MVLIRSFVGTYMRFLPLDNEPCSHPQDDPTDETETRDKVEIPRPVFFNMSSTLGVNLAPRVKTFFSFFNFF
jgi:hypothetical protein